MFMPRVQIRRSRDVRTAGRQATVIVCGLAIAAGVAACGSSSSNTGASKTGSGSASGSPIKVVAAENEYGNVASQIGGPYVSVQSIESNPNTDPHTYEVSPGVAQDVSAGQVLIENGVGYDDWMTKIADASPDSSRLIINAQHLLGLPDSTPNPHLWYKPVTMPAAAAAMAADFAKLQPAHAAYFKANVTKFDASLKPWLAAITAFKAKYGGTPVATTEPVGDYMLQAAGTDNMTPFSLQAAIMNGTDPSPQNVSDQQNLFSAHQVKVFVYNQQVTDSLTQSFITDAHKAGIPIIGVYETMPTPGYTYQTWMLAEVNALQKAVADKVSTEKL
jgi:zinc/manganese transport system substrate-binding protein